jgi:hypothetical protein
MINTEHSKPYNTGTRTTRDATMLQCLCRLLAGAVTFCTFKKIQDPPTANKRCWEQWPLCKVIWLSFWYNHFGAPYYEGSSAVSWAALTINNTPGNPLSLKAKLKLVIVHQTQHLYSGHGSGHNSDLHGP